MLRKLSGFVLIALGVLGAYLFAVIGAKDDGLLSPFYNIGAKYPYSAFVLVLSITATLGGIVIFVTKFPRKIVADILLVNSFVMLSTSSVILLGIKSNLSKVIGFVLVILAIELLIGTVLIVLSFMEKPKAWISLICGTLLHVAVAFISVMTILSGI